MVIDMDKTAHLRTRRDVALVACVVCTAAVVASLMGATMIGEIVLILVAAVLFGHVVDYQQAISDQELRD